MVRVVVGGLVAALLVGTGGCLLERARLGGSRDDAHSRIEADIQRQFTGLSNSLDRAIDIVAAEPALLTVLQTRDGIGLRDLFVRAGEAATVAAIDNVAITVYGLDGRPVAWSGRPATIPIPRLSGPDAYFLAPVSPPGLRLVRVKPIAVPGDPDRRVGVIVAEAPVPASGSTRDADAGFVLQTSIVPVPLRTRFEGAPDARDGGIVIRSVTGEPLAVAEVPASALDMAHARWRERTVAVEAGVLAVVLLLLTGPLLDRRRVRTDVREHALFTLAILGLLIAARAVLYVAVRLAGLHRPPLVSEAVGGNYWFALASPLDFLFSAFLFGGIVSLAASSFEQWRHSRRMRVRVVTTSRVGRLVGFIAAQLAAGATVAGLALEYESFIRTRLSQSPVDILHFALHPLDWERLPVVVGLVILHASLAALFVLVFRVALSRWVISGDQRWIRALIPVLWAAPAIFIVGSAMASWERPPLLPAALIVAFTMAAAWRLRRYRAQLAHASQAARLTALFVALTLPSLAFYPSLVDAAGRARRQLVEARYAPEVINQRHNLQLQVREAQAQIDSIRDLPNLVAAAQPSPGPSAPTEPAFNVWLRTVLAERRLTSSVEIYDEAGALVSRFALKLPESTGAQTWQEGTCGWEVFEEVSPFFAEERRLLHADRGICLPQQDGSNSLAGAVILHVQPDFSNLSFITAQSPYLALLRAEETPEAETTPRERVEFAVYGWSRRVLYMSGSDAWPLTEQVFPQILASREPFWAQVQRGEAEYDVYFMNDRGGIYALGYPRTSALGHLVSVAELVVLSAVTMLLLLTGGALYGVIAARTPASGRALLREVRASFYRKLFIAFVIAAVLPVLALAFVSREYIFNLMNTDVESEATRTAASASRVVEDVGTLEVRGGSNLEVVDDNLVVWLSRVVAQDVNIFDGAGLLASSERALFASGILPTRTPGDVYRAIVLEGRPSYVYRETVAGYPFLVAAAPVRVQNRPAILTVPLTLRQQELEAQIDELDRRVLLAAVLFIIVGAGIGYWMAERIADPVNRLMKATARIARGDLDARILATSSDEFRRLVEAFNRMAADLLRQRAELARTHRLAAWADMARQVAHDIKNPLTPIQLNAEHLRRVHEDRGEPLGPILDQSVTNILTQVKLLRQLASEFSSFASSPTAKPAPMSLSELMTDVVEPYRTGLSGRVSIDVDVPASLPPLLVDKNLLARAVTNIIENALHAMPNGGTLRIDARPLPDGRVQLAIGDTGIGMDRDALARIFEPYFSTRAAGTGLGLTIAKRNTELNNGTIEVTSEKGKGTTVTLKLPTAA